MRMAPGLSLGFLLLLALSASAEPRRGDCIPTRSEYKPLDCTQRSACDECVLWRVVRDTATPGACTVGMWGGNLGTLSPMLHCEARGTAKDNECACVLEKAAVLNADKGCGHFLLVPDVPVQGIEVDALYSKESPDYWQKAWNAGRGLVPDDKLALAVNSFYGRTREQLHIHMAFLAGGVRENLDKLTGFPSTTTLFGHSYAVHRLPGSTLSGETDPFRYAESHASSCPDRRRRTLAVTRGPEGSFLLLIGCAENGGGHGEELLDTKVRACSKP